MNHGVVDLHNINLQFIHPTVTILLSAQSVRSIRFDSVPFVIPYFQAVGLFSTYNYIYTWKNTDKQ